MKKIAIIGASSGQLPIVKKACEIGYQTFCFAWEKGAVCKDFCDRFFPISIFDTDKIIQKCRELDVDGIVTNASEETAYVASVVASALNLNSVSPDVIKLVQDKRAVRELTRDVPGLSVPDVYKVEDRTNISYPCVVKPIKGSAKKGVSFCEKSEDLDSAVEYAYRYGDDILIEQYIGGEEYSVETISFHGRHQVIQITKKVTSGFPHFVELEHHQPAVLADNMREKVERLIGSILTKVGFDNGASHTEIKIDGNQVYLIEINPRGGGDHISDTLTFLSTDCDYLREMINVAVGDFKFLPVNNVAYSGIMFLNKQNSRVLKYFDCPQEPWMVERTRDSDPLRESTSNYDRNGYLIYNSKKPLEL